MFVFSVGLFITFVAKIAVAARLKVTKSEVYSFAGARIGVRASFYAVIVPTIQKNCGFWAAGFGVCASRLFRAFATSLNRLKRSLKRALKRKTCRLEPGKLN